MSEEEKKLLLEIDALYHNLSMARIGLGIGNFGSKPNSHSYIQTAKKLEKKVYELFNEYKPEYLTESVLHAITHTIGKEVEYVDYHYTESIKPRASKSKHQAFLDSMSAATARIGMDLNLLFLKLKEIK